MKRSVLNTFPASILRFNSKAAPTKSASHPYPLYLNSPSLSSGTRTKPNRPENTVGKMFGRIRASPSSLESLEGSPPSKILKDDSFSIYEATLMKLKLGAKRDKPPMKTEEKEFTNDFSVTDEANMEVDCTPATGIAEASSSIGDNDGKATLMDTDCCSCVATMTSAGIITGVRDSVSTENNTEPPRQNNVSIRKFYSLLTKNSSSCGSASSSGSVVSNGDTRSGLCE